MSFGGLHARLAEGQVARWGAVGLGLTAAALAFGWPTSSGDANEAWVGVAAVRALTTAALALGQGVLLWGAPPREVATGTSAVVLITTAGLPLERIAHAGVAGPLPDVWAWAWTVAAPLGHLAIGALVAGLLTRVRLRFLAPLAVGGYLVAAVAASVRWGWSWFDPIAAALGDPKPLLVWVAAALVAGAVVGGAWRRHRR